MTEPNLRKTDLQQLSRLWQHHDDASADWRPDELAAVFDHLWIAPLADELAALDPQLPTRMSHWKAESGASLDTLGDLFEHPQPPLDLLNLVKRYARRAGRDESLPVDVAAVVYAAAICAAQVRCGQRITSADDRALQSKIRWAASRDWIRPTTKRLFEEALAALPNPE